ncbi:MAG: GNAT family N-acetyltransferase [Kofleriaceae bacterium]
MFGLRIATSSDLEDLVPRTRALNDHEGITVATPTLREAMSVLLQSPSLGGVWIVTRDGAPIGYAIVTYGFDLEFAGRDAWMTELWIDEEHRRSGAGAAAIELLVPELKLRGVGALHLQVRPENPAKRLYERTSFVASPRIVMTRTIE